MIKAIFSITFILVMPLYSMAELLPNAPQKVKIEKQGKGYQLTVNGAPYFIKGAGGYTYYEDLKRYGGNSVRLWSTVGAKEYLDKAQELGLTVTLGLYM